jgi:exopolyphosphatase/guanosine-5'-triphosphate,3'-diphosphate pyrophosphatase
VHGACLPRSAIEELLSRLAGMTVEEIRALPSMHPGRADVITGGALVESRIGARLNVDNLIVSESDILDGIALELIDR